MAEMNLDYYHGEDRYSDGDVEDRILRDVQTLPTAAGRGTSMEGLIAEAYGKEKAEDAFAYLYHLSPVREGILSWYPFRKGASALEIGAGPGAITGTLCRSLGSVTSVDLSGRRCRINYERHKAADNLKIMVGNLNEMQFPGLFDYVILNGVFEYAGSFTEGPHPYESFLKKCAGFLKEDGVLLVAIENRLGLKYFAGAPEDHTGNYMEGLKDYQAGSGVRTFSKAEWVRLSSACKLEIREIYYPYPDYKFPAEVFTDRSLSADAWQRASYTFDARRMELFPEGGMARSLQEEGVLGSFMNSFLVELMRRPSGQTAEASEPKKGEGGRRPQSGVLYAKLSEDRGEAFRIQTVIREKQDGDLEVVKSPLTDRARAHLDRMQQMAGRTSACRQTLTLDGVCYHVRILEGERTGEGLVYPYLKGRKLGQEAAEAAEKGDRGRIQALTDALWGMLLSGSGRQEGSSVCGQAGFPGGPVQAGARQDQKVQARAEIFGPGQPSDPGPLLVPANIDLIFDNLILEGDTAWIIDGEWIFDFPLPARFLLWRAVNEVYACHPDLERAFSSAGLLARYGIGKKDAALYRQWADHFTQVYVGAGSLNRYVRPALKADLKDLHVFGGQVRLTSTLYLDRGWGFSEEEAVRLEGRLDEDGDFRADFEIPRPEGVKALRFDPLEGSCCICTLACPEGRLKPLNASSARKRARIGDQEARVCEFLTEDPSYLLLTGGQVPGRVRIRGKVQMQTQQWALERARFLLSRYQRIVRI